MALGTKNLIDLEIDLREIISKRNESSSLLYKHR
jgi:hypothetical protein